MAVTAVGGCPGGCVGWNLLFLTVNQGLHWVRWQGYEELCVWKIGTKLLVDDLRSASQCGHLFTGFRQDIWPEPGFLEGSTLLG